MPGDAATHTPHFLGSVLLLLDLLATVLLGLGDAVTHQSVLGLELLGGVDGLVDKTEAAGAPAAKSGLEPKQDNKRLKWKRIERNEGHLS